MKPETHAALCAEILRGRTKFPGNRFMLAGLVEEVGELAEALIGRDTRRIAEEALQVAAVAVRIAEEGDATPWHGSRFASLVIALGDVARWALQRQPVHMRGRLLQISHHASALLSEPDSTFDTVSEEEMQP